ncbi:TIPRL [Lepeophtheirus salmonis]|uniref:TIP41-like protein n=1 Tax=Lepeophtheirus salmonis TaxID=72036 RepID=A0A7R8CGA6_LEPSM|nr:TIPRL [Lepeophtheirus salmonis]CAF2808198.1 TIPRL [Lepeophtheirus salmonis]
MTSTEEEGSNSRSKNPTEVEHDFFGEWTIKATKGSRIMSKEETEKTEPLFKIPHLPDMLFLHNQMELIHNHSGAVLKMDPLSALKCVDPINDSIKGYTGELSGFQEIAPTDLKINYEKLKEREPILFFEDVILYEDELDDNGSSSLSVKIRGMSSGVFCLMRFYLRVDNTMIRVIDTRHYLERGNPYILREYIEKEAKTSDIDVPMVIMKDSNEIIHHLPVINEKKGNTSC